MRRCNPSLGLPTIPSRGPCTYLIATVALKQEKPSCFAYKSAFFHSLTIAVSQLTPGHRQTRHLRKGRRRQSPRRRRRPLNHGRLSGKARWGRLIGARPTPCAGRRPAPDFRATCCEGYAGASAGGSLGDAARPPVRPKASGDPRHTSSTGWPGPPSCAGLPRCRRVRRRPPRWLPAAPCRPPAPPATCPDRSVW